MKKTATPKPKKTKLFLVKIGFKFRFEGRKQIYMMEQKTKKEVTYRALSDDSVYTSVTNKNVEINFTNTLNL